MEPHESEYVIDAVVDRGLDVLGNISDQFYEEDSDVLVEIVALFHEMLDDGYDPTFEDTAIHSTAKDVLYERGYTIERDEDEGLTMFDPDGERVI